jgi:transketolase
VTDSLPAQQLRNLANAIRVLAMDAVETAQSGHPGMPMGMADVATVLFTRHLKFYAAKPRWPDRDRFILSAGHGSMLLYALSYLTGYAAMTMDEIKRFRALGSRTPGHPEHDVDAGVEMTTGPLGQGLGAAVGFAIAEHLSRARLGDALVNHRTYVMAGDGCMQEGVTHEACSLAGHLRLKNLVVLYDDNDITIDGPTHLSFSEDVAARFAAYGWATRRVDGHNMDEIHAALTWARGQDRPVLLLCKTTIGFGAGEKAGTADAHGAPLGADAVAAARKNLNWPYGPFVVPDDILSAWRDAGARGRDAYTTWETRLAAADDTVRQGFIDAQAGVDGHAAARAVMAATEKFLAAPAAMATRKASQLVLEELVAAVPNLIGGSADLTGSNLTKVAGHKNFSGCVIPAEAGIPLMPGPGLRRGDDPFYIHYGVREHGMGAIMNGLALYGGWVPYGGTFLCFADYARPAIRLAALMRTQVIYVMTHDSIGLGEDGPTHQPVEHLASLRAMPHVQVLRPADAVETAACWAAALSYKTGPTILCLSRQNVGPVHGAAIVGVGPFIVRDDDAPRVVICATGSEVSLAMAVADQLMGIAVRVVSVPYVQAMRDVGADARAVLLNTTGGALVAAVEAGVRQGWDDIIGPGGLFFGLNDFGASGKYQDVYKDRGLTPEDISRQILSHLAR